MDDPISELKRCITGRDIRGVREIFFEGAEPRLRSGLFREDQWWDFKAEIPHPSKSNDLEWAKIATDVAAFHNQEGGVIFFGIRDKDYKFVGANSRLDTKLFNDKIRKYVGDRFWASFSREFIQPDQRYLGIAIIPPRTIDHVRLLREGPLLNGKPIFKAGDLCIRMGDETRILRGSEAITFSATRGMGVSAATFIVDESNYRILRPDYKQFIRREALCGQIESAMSSQRTFVTSLTGMGGIGKTALGCWTVLGAYEKKVFDFIVSVSARDRALTSSGIVATLPTFSSLRDLLREICEVTGFGEYNDIESEDEQLKVVREHILSQFPGLLFVDNLETVDDPKIVQFLEDLPLPTKAITTSRKTKVRVANYPIEVGPFDREEAVSFLNDTSQRVGKGFLAGMSAAEQEMVVSACDKIPLVIEWLVGRSRDEDHALKIAASLEAHGKHGEELLEFSFRRIYEEMTQDQRSILQVISLINKPLPIEAVAVASDLPMHKTADVLEELKDYSIIERIYDGNYHDLVYSLLPVTSTFVYRELTKSTGVESTVRKRLSSWYEARDIHDPAQRQLVQDVRQGEKNPEIALLQVARNYQAQGDLDNAEDYYKRALERNPRSWQCHREMAEFYRHQRDSVANALVHYKQAAEFGPKHGPERGKIFREYGIILRNSGQPSGVRDAVAQLEIALAELPNDVVCRHALGDCHVRLMAYERAIWILKPLEDSLYRDTRKKTYPLLERCYEGTNRLLELQLLRAKIAKDV